MRRIVKHCSWMVVLVLLFCTGCTSQSATVDNVPPDNGNQVENKTAQQDDYVSAGNDGDDQRSSEEPQVSDAMSSRTVDGVEVTFTVIDGKGWTFPNGNLEVPCPEGLHEGGVYRGSGTVQLLNGGIAGFHDYMAEIYKVDDVVEIEPAEVDLPSIEESNLACTSLLGDYAPGDMIFVYGENGRRSAAIWDEGGWTWRYSKEVIDVPSHSTKYFSVSDVSYGFVREGWLSGTLVCPDFLVWPGAVLEESESEVVQRTADNEDTVSVVSVTPVSDASTNGGDE